MAALADSLVTGVTCITLSGALLGSVRLSLPLIPTVAFAPPPVLCMLWLAYDVLKNFIRKMEPWSYQLYNLYATYMRKIRSKIRHPPSLFQTFLTFQLI